MCVWYLEKNTCSSKYSVFVCAICKWIFSLLSKGRSPQEKAFLIHSHQTSCFLCGEKIFLLYKSVICHLCGSQSLCHYSLWEGPLGDVNFSGLHRCWAVLWPFSRWFLIGNACQGSGCSLGCVWLWSLSKPCEDVALSSSFFKYLDHLDSDSVLVTFGLFWVPKAVLINWSVISTFWKYGVACGFDQLSSALSVATASYILLLYLPQFGGIRERTLR